ncbi:MAG TPA: pyridoxamine 5'-phosphate oxidase family protein [Actinomycetota bacterium]|jgi:PPOX class probable F420-dependent enzyme|nr:pyridoxamine 5'-phosphate oxidase family protein [Actinomycetota bacterium]
MDPKAREFLEHTRSAAMVTLRKDGTPHAVRVGLALVDGRLWSSSTRGRARDRHLRRDPRATLFVWDSSNPENAYKYLTLETTVTILDGPDSSEKTLRLFKVMQGIDPADPSPRKINWFGQELDDDEFIDLTVKDGRIVYEFKVNRSYGLS